VDGKILEALNVPLDTEIEVRIISPPVFHSGPSLSFYLSNCGGHAHDARTRFAAALPIDSSSLI